MLSNILKKRTASRIPILVIFFDWIAAFAAVPGLNENHLSLHKWCFCFKRNKKHQRNMSLSSQQSDFPHLEAFDTNVLKSCSRLLGDFIEVVDDFESKALVNQINRDDGSIFQYIRLQKEPSEETLHYISTKERIIQKIKDVREKQNCYGRADLYAREWEPCRENDQELTINLSNTSFTVIQFNSLAEGLSSCSSKRPFQADKAVAQLDPAEYGGFSSVQYPFITLDFELRKWRLVEVLFGQNLDTEYDVIAMEEVDRYHGFFGPLFENMGYNSLFVPKKNSPGVRMGWYSDGCVLAWKSSTFDLVHAQYGDYSVGNQVYIIATLQHRLTKQSVIVAVTHLKAQQKEMNEVVRNRQVNELLACIDNEAMRFTNFFPDMQLQVVVLGDFNADPPSLMNSDRSAIQKLLTHKIHGIDECYHSAYEIDDSLDNSFTTWKIRAHNECKRIIDYIFYAGSSLRCLATYKAVSPSDIEDSKLPVLRHPSDHMHIAAKFDFLKT